MNAFLHILRIEMVLFTRDRIALFWTFGFPLLLLIVQMTLFGHGVSLGTAKIAIVDPVRSTASSSFSHFILEHTANMKTLKIKADIVAKFPHHESDYNALLVLPDDFSHKIEAGGSAQVSLILYGTQDPTRSALEGILRGATNAYNLATIAATQKIPVELSARNPVTSSASQDYRLYLVTGLMVMVMLSTGLMGFTIPLVASREGGMFRLYQILPISPSLILMAMALSRLLITVLASLVLIIVATSLYAIPLPSSGIGFGAVLIVLVLGAAASLSLGLVISTFASSVTAATMLCNLIYFPLLFTGNLMMPVGNLPGIVKNILSFLPVNATVSSLRRAFSGQFSTTADLITVIALTFFCLVGVFVAHRRFRWAPQQ